MIEYYIDGSTKENMIGVGIVKVNEFGFIEKHHYNVEHISATSTIGEGYSLEKTLELIKKCDVHKNELIDIYTDCKKLVSLLRFNENISFNRNDFFVNQESNSYFQHIRNQFLELISRNSNSAIYHCAKTHQARPLIKVYFKDALEDKKYLNEAHRLSRQYIKEEAPAKVELKAIRKNSKWYIVKDNKETIAENKRPLIALSNALKLTETNTKQINLCERLQTILKSTSKNKLTSDAMKSAYKIIEDHRLLINL